MKQLSEIVQHGRMLTNSLMEDKAEDFKTEDEMVNYLKSKIPKSLLPYITFKWRTLLGDRELNLYYIYDKVQQKIEQNSHWYLLMSLEGSPETDSVPEKWDIRTTHGLASFKRKPSVKKELTFKKSADRLIAMLKKNETKLQTQNEESPFKY